jgi:hypothetical protein
MERQISLKRTIIAQPDTTASAWRIRNSQGLGSAPGEFRIQSYTGNLLNPVWFLDLKFLTVDATEILGTSTLGLTSIKLCCRAAAFPARVDTIAIRSGESHIAGSIL